VYPFPLASSCPLRPRGRFVTPAASRGGRGLLGRLLSGQLVLDGSIDRLLYDPARYPSRYVPHRRKHQQALPRADEHRVGVVSVDEAACQVGQKGDETQDAGVSSSHEFPKTAVKFGVLAKV